MKLDPHLFLLHLVHAISSGEAATGTPVVLSPPARSWVKAVVSRDCQLVQFAAGKAVVALSPPGSHWTLIQRGGLPMTATSTFTLLLNSAPGL